MLKSFKSGGRGRRHGKGAVTSDEEPGARPTRHIHEFLALGIAPHALDDESAEKMKWVDLVALNTPGIYINSSSPTTPANAAFVLSDRNNFMGVCAITRIEPLHEIFIDYMPPA